MLAMFYTTWGNTQCSETLLVYLFARLVVTEHRKLDGWPPATEAFSHGSGSWTSKVKVPRCHALSKNSAGQGPSVIAGVP